MALGLTVLYFQKQNNFCSKMAISGWEKLLQISTTILVKTNKGKEGKKHFLADEFASTNLPNNNNNNNT